MGGGIVSLGQVLLLLPSSLAFGKPRGYTCMSAFSSDALFPPVVTNFVFQADDTNADKNVSSAQIVGKCDSRSLKTQPFTLL